MSETASQLSDEAYLAFLETRRAELLERIASAAARAGRAGEEVGLVAVSKTVGPHELALAARSGYRVFGENRPQELSRKVAAAREDPALRALRFDLIGNLQRNKVNQVLAAGPTLIHSVSSLHLAEAIAVRAAARGLCAHVLLEVNVSGEASKSGFSPEEARAETEDAAALEGLVVDGVMAMAPANDAAAARRTFCELRELRDELVVRTGLSLATISCGMSDDFEIAVEEGSTLVRLGRIVFDPSY